MKVSEAIGEVSILTGFAPPPTTAGGSDFGSGSSGMTGWVEDEERQTAGLMHLHYPAGVFTGG